MSNPAAELADLFDSWVMENERPRFARGGTDDVDQVAFWRGQARAVSLLGQVCSAIDALREAGEDVRGFEPFIEEWHKALFSFDHPWAGNYTGPALRAEALASLRSLGLILGWSARSRGISTAQVSQLHEVLRDARDLLREKSSELDEVEYLYLARLLSAVEDAIEEHAAGGTIDLREHLDRLNGALVSVAAKLTVDGEEETGRKVWSIALRLVSVYRGVLGDAGQWAAITGLTMQQLVNGH